MSEGYVFDANRNCSEVQTFPNAMAVDSVSPRAYAEFVRPYFTKVLLMPFVGKVNGS